MNIFLIILLIFIALIALLFIMALFVKKEYRIEAQVIINKPVAEVFGYVKIIRNQEHYSKWVMADPNLKKTLTGTDGTVGYVYAWKSEVKGVGEGAQEITGMEENKKINTRITFIKPFKGTGHVTMRTDETAQNETRVTWIMEGKNKYPMNALSIVMNKILHNDMQFSLQTLKHNLENK